MRAVAGVVVVCSAAAAAALAVGVSGLVKWMYHCCVVCVIMHAAFGVVVVAMQHIEFVAKRAGDTIHLLCRPARYTAAWMQAAAMPTACFTHLCYVPQKISYYETVWRHGRVPPRNGLHMCLPALAGANGTACCCLFQWHYSVTMEVQADMLAAHVLQL
jgi:hypothetical protein